MNLSPLQLEQYFVTELSFSSNRAFDPHAPASIEVDQVTVEHNCQQTEKDRTWQVTLGVKLHAPADANAPYHLAVEMVGIFSVLEGFPDEKEERMVKINGPSMLYGIAREVIRDVTSRGPYFPILLPSANFFEPALHQPPPEVGV